MYCREFACEADRPPVTPKMVYDVMVEHIKDLEVQNKQLQDALDRKCDSCPYIRDEKAA
jgi:hypothetical protein